MRIIFIGGGNMTRAIVSGLIPTHRVKLYVVDRKKATCFAFQQEFNIQAGTILPDPILENDVIVLAVKPLQMAAASAILASAIHPKNPPLVISIAAGVYIKTLSRWLGHHRLVRVMPNTPATIGLGISGVFSSPSIAANDTELACQIMQTVGKTVQVRHEEDIDSITALSGSGPAYVFYMMESLIMAAKSYGFEAETAQQLILATFKGAVALAEQSADELAVLRQKVTSPKGTTEAALRCFEQEGLAVVLKKGADAARSKAKAIGLELDLS
ncbi:MAG: pyrroline-5-carboxylate reductase [Neisseriaceae bacterium]|nr:pyrroline-5-carboxylate reductase [Neisseriaceae bacterium]